MSEPLDPRDQTTLVEEFDDAETSSVLEAMVLALENWRTLVIIPVLAALVAAAATFVVKPTYTARTTLLPPQQSPQSSALAALGSLATLATSAGGLRTSSDMYGALLQSTGVEDRLVEQFKLVEVYDVDYRADARLRLEKRTRVDIGKKDGLITLEVDDESPARAAEIANAYVVELRRVTSQLALTEAQQRRVFFEARLKKTRDDLTKAQRELQSSGFSGGALRAEPRLAAESYARLKAELTAAELRLLAQRDSFAESAPEVQRQAQQVGALRSQLARVESQDASQGSSEYIGRYREFKYQESLFELFSRQYELARTDEAREGAIIQVVDQATPPEKRSKPNRRLIVMLALVGGFGFAACLVALRRHWQRLASDPEQAALMERYRAVLGRR